MTMQTPENSVKLEQAVDFIIKTILNRQVPDKKKEEAVSNLLLTSFVAGQGIPVFSVKEVKDYWNKKFSIVQIDEKSMNLNSNPDEDDKSSFSLWATTDTASIQGQLTSKEMQMIVYWMMNSDLFKEE